MAARTPDRADEPLSLFAVSAPGVETITAGELAALGLAGGVVVPGGVEFPGDRTALYRANLELRTAGRVLLRAGRFQARAFTDLRRRAVRVPWERFLAPGEALALRVTCRKSRLYHSGAVAERIAEAIAERLGFAPARVSAAADPDASEPGPEAAGGPRVQLVLARLDHDVCTLSIDSSGEPLHRRGWRQETGRAPLRETLAAALLLASGWDGTSPLVDPFCGAGTIPIEAALLARRRAPGRGRAFACQAWRDFDSAAFARLCGVADARAAAAPAPPPILGCDRDAGAIAAARANALRAGVAGDLTLAQSALSKLAPQPGPGFVVSDPPHGVRLRSGGDLRNLYARFGAVLRERCPDWGVALLSSSARLHGASGLPLETRGQVRHGGLRLTLLVGRVPAGA